jgi:predicted phage terminase large subunit-like protein
MHKYEDPLEREPGDDFAPRWVKEDLEALKKGSPRAWHSVFQQTPRTIGGSLIKIDCFRKIKLEEVPPRGVIWLRGWDLAFSEKQVARSDPSFTCGAKLGLYKNNAEYAIIITDISRWQSTWPTTKQRIFRTAHEDGIATKLVIESGGPQKGLVEELRSSRELAAFSVLKSTPVADKVARANYWTEKLEMGKISIVEAGWNGDFLDECEIFNNGPHNDQVDAVSIAYWELAKRLRSSLFKQVKMKGLYS